MPEKLFPGWLIVFIVIVTILVLIFATRRSSYEGYDEDHPVIQMLKLRIARLNPEFVKIPMQISNESYTELKRNIYLCIYDENGMVYDTNTLTHVVLHEISHMLSGQKLKGNEHDAEFTSIFYSLLAKAERVGIYNPNIPVPSNYCKNPHKPVMDSPKMIALTPTQGIVPLIGEPAGYVSLV